jgi:hypothetical protein
MKFDYYAKFHITNKLDGNGLLKKWKHFTDGTEAEKFK